MSPEQTEYCMAIRDKRPGMTAAQALITEIEERDWKFGAQSRYEDGFDPEVLGRVTGDWSELIALCGCLELEDVAEHPTCNEFYDYMRTFTKLDHDT